LAAWWVVVFHFREALPPQAPAFLHSFASYGYLAVDLFFILSGFVIARSYSHHFSRSIEIKTVCVFYGFRLARIYPLHFFVLLLFLINPIALTLFANSGMPPDGYELNYYIMSIFLIQNWGWTNDIQWNIPAWSISTEWFAYLIFPLIAIVATRFIKNAATALASALALLLILALVTAITGGGLGGNIPQYGLLRCLLEFGVGVALCRLHLAYPAQPATARLAFYCAITCFAALAIMPDYTVIPLGFSCLIYAITTNSIFFSALLQNRFLEWIGLISYSTYLIHYFIKIWIKFLMVESLPNVENFYFYLVATAGASVLLFYAIERPAQQKMRAAVTGLLAPQPRTALSP
jgi:peptidoglycan/LPS O-acetylase OafA/YrhL